MRAGLTNSNRIFAVAAKLNRQFDVRQKPTFIALTYVGHEFLETDGEAVQDHASQVACHGRLVAHLL